MTNPKDSVGSETPRTEMCGRGNYWGQCCLWVAGGNKEPEYKRLERELHAATERAEQLQAQLSLYTAIAAQCGWSSISSRPEHLFVADKLEQSQAECERLRKQCKMQDGPDIPWSLAEIIWQGYAKLGGSDQPLERVNARGGFGWEEVAYMWKQPRARAAMEKAAINTASTAAAKEGE